MWTQVYHRHIVFGPWVNYGARTRGCRRHARKHTRDDQHMYPLLAKIDRLYYAAIAAFAASLIALMAE